MALPLSDRRARISTQALDAQKAPVAGRSLSLQGFLVVHKAALEEVVAMKRKGFTVSWPEP